MQETIQREMEEAREERRRQMRELQHIPRSLSLLTSSRSPLHDSCSSSTFCTAMGQLSNRPRTNIYVTALLTPHPTVEYSEGDLLRANPNHVGEEWDNTALAPDNSDSEGERHDVEDLISGMAATTVDDSDPVSPGR
jgi:hypothetical protein